MLPLSVAACVAVFANDIIALAKYMPACPFYELLHLYCPACGNTRSVVSLLEGDILLSLRYNITVPFLLLVSALFYVEGLGVVFGRRIRIVPKKYIVLYVILGLFVCYYLVRNFFI